MARHPNGPGRAWRAVGRLLAQPALALLVLALAVATLLVLGRLLTDAGWLLTPLPLRPGLWR